MKVFISASDGVLGLDTEVRNLIDRYIKKGRAFYNAVYELKKISRPPNRLRKL